ncbi:MAG: hypothetical protein HRT61_05340 [Ekhidna sp.]|nr:hypothetical protein [Ekhidna sp.]
MKKIRLAVNESERDQVLSIVNEFPLEESLEVVSINDTLRDSGIQVYLEVRSGSIYSFPDWFNQSLPFLFPKLPLNKGNLVGLLFYHLGLVEDALAVSAGAEINAILNGLLNGANQLNWLDRYQGEIGYAHNIAIISYYYTLDGVEQIQQSFHQAVAKEGSTFLKAYSLKHESVFKQEAGLPLDEALINEVLADAELHDSARNSLRLELIKAELSQIELQGISAAASLKENLGSLCTFYKSQNSSLIVADLLSEMSGIAAQDGNFTESLSYINQAIEIYQQEELDMLCAELYTKKAGILHQWAKGGMSHFYQEAIKAFQEVLKTIKQSDFPYWFADIHHRLGVLYAEMPEEQQKRSIWAAVSATSFQEALTFFTKDEYPFEYAAVCHNYATALINYPAAVKTDNIEKALHYFNESLAIRTAEELPRERTVTLLNYLEASWEASNINSMMEKVRLDDMRDKSNEVLSLTEEPEMIERAQQHLASIEELDNQLSNA